MKKWLMSVFILALCMCVPVLKSDAVTVSTIVGSQVNCDTALTGCQPPPPLNATILCNGSGIITNCPQFFEPDWTTTNRLWGVTNRVLPPKLVTSVDGGTTWTLGTTDPFTAAVLGLGINFAVSSNGSLLASGGQGVNTCIIRRSTDQGVTWSTVYSELVNFCELPAGSPTSNPMTCASSGGYCVVFARDAAFGILPITSTDNGATWTLQTGYSYVSTGPLQVALSNTGSSGVESRMVSNTVPFAVKSGNTFTITGNANIANSQTCMGLVMGTNTKVVCGPSNVVPTATSWQFADAVTPIATTFNVPDGQTFAQSPQPHVIGYSSTIGYMLLPSISNVNNLNVFITNNTWSSVINIGVLTPTTPPIIGCCRGNVYVWNNKIYFSSGGGGPTAFLIVIQ